MSADILREVLDSGIVRKALPNLGKRIFRANSESPKKNNNGNIIGWLWNAGERFLGIIGNAIKLVAFSATAIWGFIVSTTQFIWNFNWNISDDDINKQIQSKFESLASFAGGALGNAFGYLACGALPGATIFAFNPQLGALILKNVGEEGLEEFIGNLSSLIQLTFTSGLQSLLLWAYSNIRKFIKSNIGLAQKLFGDNTKKLIQAWGEKNSKPWSFSQKTEEAVESIKNTALRGFVEEFLEEAWEGCVEAGYVVAGSIDTYIAQQKLSQELFPILGDNKVVEITPNRDNSEEKIILAGPEEVLKPTILNTLAQHQLIANRDIGNVYNIDPDKLGNKRRKSRPKINLYFLQSTKDLQVGEKKQLSGMISFRIMEYTSETISKEYLINLATKIKQKFGNPPFIWQKGKELYSYTDWDLGYQFQILTTSENDAKRIIENILDLRLHTPNWNYMNRISAINPNTKYPNNPDKITVLGKKENLPQKRRNASVTFRYASCELYGTEKPIILYDRTKRYPDPLIRD